MKDFETLSDIDVVVSKIAKHDASNGSMSTFLCEPTFNESNNKTIMNNSLTSTKEQSTQISTARAYEMKSGTLNESFSLIDESENGTAALEHSEHCSSNDLIVIVSDDVKDEEMNELSTKFKNRLKYIIHYGNNVSVKNLFEPFAEFISVNTLKNAVNKSYQLVKDQQTIFVPRANTSFDYFGHVDFS